AKSTKLFTLSALVQAYARSMTGEREAIKDVTMETFQIAEKHHEFIQEYWRHVSQQYGPLWVPAGKDVSNPSERLEYLKERRGEANVAFQATFLQALGQLGYALGRLAKWDPEDKEYLPLLKKLKGMNLIVASKGEKSLPADYDQTWVNIMMKPSLDE